VGTSISITDKEVAALCDVADKADAGAYAYLCECAPNNEAFVNGLRAIIADAAPKGVLAHIKEAFRGSEPATNSIDNPTDC
jgi:hypothetical protein